MSEEDTSLMDELTAAWEEHENEVPEDTADESSSEPEEIDGPIIRAESDEGGDNPVRENVRDNEIPSNKKVNKGQVPSVDDAPKGLSPIVRGNWKNYDSETKNEFRRYEDRISGMAQKYAEKARRADAMDAVIQPYSQLMQMNGGPQNILPGLLQTGAALQTGNEVERARTVAELISQFKVSPSHVADFLENKTPKKTKEDELNSLVEQRLAPFQQQLQKMQQREHQAQQQGKQQINSELQSFAKDNEFFPAVRESMADIMDIASRNGKNMDLKSAYEAACYQNPHIRKVLMARQSQGQVQQRKRAASSIHGTPGGEGSNAASTDLRTTLEQAFQNANRM